MLNEKETQNGLKIAIKEIPIKQYGKQGVSHHCFGVGIRDGLYSEKGTLYLPNFADKHESWRKILEYQLSASDSQNGQFKRFLLSLIHETIHLELLKESVEICEAFDNIDKDNSGNYVITSELYRNEEIKL